MNAQPHSTFSELLADHALITEAITRAVREAVLKHAREGHAVATWQEGKVTWLQPEEVLSRLQAR